MKVIIISGGNPPSQQLLMNEITEDAFLIGADSGANCLYDYNINPHLLVGDFDSIDKEALDYFKKNNSIIDIYPTEKDFTDTEIAVKKALKMKPNEIVLLGCTGSRVDHLLGNIGMLKSCLENGVSACIKDENNNIRLIDAGTSLSGTVGDIFSVQSYGDEIIGLTIKGAKYPLNNYNLKIGQSITISNEFAGPQVQLKFKSGTLMIILSSD
ncbi:thiamine diphosphokinase [Clostridium sp. CM028]|uniref:thiamine diphosphokinase n=1 Tax=Clostridium TaxID=1485 RepID=UPI0013EEB5FB|nr:MULTISPECIES: thiamine diphosphokinase [Clostridium]MBU3091603.1 thiamine diphosphokinase [Clostridium sp. CF011]MBW9144132.1 thiamine diphosphokinase [Clostridium sp. CM027]MBW9147557.1 thiamine diphosphokinase [Clostridium sp. CM028]MBZ9608342.1 thiamine diphosphokinase [Clostridium estertheticum]UVE41225.1 thiamine diphosphokinase [Clostridium sp. CM027]